ncbi:MAG: glycosyltransferase family 2 protein [Bryobacteraceae bacterium]
MPNLSIVLPLYNEEGAAEPVIKAVHGILLAARIPFEIVTVQNGSRDRTPEILARLAERLAELRIVEVPVNRGFGYGVLQGLKACSGEVIGYMPGDGQIDPEVLPRLYSRMIEASADLAQGRRIRRGDGPLRWFISKVYNLLASALLGLPGGDLNGHPKLMTRDLYTALRLCSEDHFLDAELMAKAHRLGARITALDLNFLPRAAGCSKVRIGTCFEFVVNLARLRLQPRDPWGLYAIPRNALERRAPQRTLTR